MEGGGKLQCLKTLKILLSAREVGSSQSTVLGAWAFSWKLILGRTYVQIIC